MKPFINLLGSGLMLAGIALLGYVGVSYERGRAAQSTQNWSASQREQGTRLARQLAHHQTLAVPKSVQRSVPHGGAEPAIRIVIPRIQLNAPVVETPPVGGTWDVADWAVGHLTTTPYPGAAGNMALSAHDDIKGEIFKRLNELTPGSVIYLYTRHARYTYVVTGQQVVDPSNVTVLNPTRTATLTMISCTPYWVDTQRLVVQALLKTSVAV